MKRQSLGLAKEELDKVFKYWIKKLGLERWHIVWDFFPAPLVDDELQYTQGETLSDSLNHTAIIKILPLELWMYPDTPHDVEQVSVHELLHAKWDALWRQLEDEPVLRDMLHEYIDEIAWNLVEERRVGNKSLAPPPKSVTKKAKQSKTKCSKKTTKTK